MEKNKTILVTIFVCMLLFNIVFGCLFYLNEMRDFDNYARRSGSVIAHQLIELIDPNVFNVSKKVDDLKIRNAFKKHSKEIGLLNIAVYDKKGECLYASSDSPSVLENLKDKDVGKTSYHLNYQSLYGMENNVFITSAVVDIKNSPHTFVIDLNMTSEYNAAMHDAKLYTFIIFVLSIFFFSILAFLMRRFNVKAKLYVDVIESQKKETERLSHVKQEFLTMMSHELRTPMNGFLGVLELIKHTKLTLKQKELLGVAEFSGKHLLDILNDVLDFSKLEAGKLSIQKVPFCLIKTLNSLIQMNQIVANQKGIELTLKTDFEKEIWVRSDSLRICQVLQNLLSNAIKFTDRGYVELSVEKMDKSQVGGGERFIFSVKDTGIGILKEQMKNLFDQYTSVNESTSRVYGGTGLGLSIAKKITILMGGDITVQSMLGEGSTFTVFLPLELADSPVGYDKKHDLLMIKHKVLVVDDNIVNQMVLKGILEKQGHDVVLASNGREALDQVMVEEFDYIFLDIYMPGMNGVDVAKEIRALEEQNIIKKAVIIACSANDIDDSELVSFDNVLQKPIDLKKLLALMK